MHSLLITGKFTCELKAPHFKREKITIINQCKHDNQINTEVGLPSCHHMTRGLYTSLKLLLLLLLLPFSLGLFVYESMPASIINVLGQFQLHQFWKDSRNMSWKVKNIRHLPCYKGGVLGFEGLAGPLNFSIRASLWISFWPQGLQDKG